MTTPALPHADQTTEWYEITHKDKYSGEVYLELTFYSNVSITVRLKLTSGRASGEARCSSTCCCDWPREVLAHAHERLGHEPVHSSVRTAGQAAEPDASASTTVDDATEHPLLPELR